MKPLRPTSIPLRLLLGLTLSIAGLPACSLQVNSALSKASAEDEDSLVADHLELVAGDGQTAAASATLPTNPAVRVVDADGNPVSGYTVSFVVSSGGGTLGGASAVSNAQGIASTTFTLGSTVGAGAHTITASNPDLPGVTRSIVFTSSACQALPSGVVSWWDGDLVSGNSHSDLVSTNHGTAVGGATVAAGKVGNAISLDGLTGAVTVPDAANLDFTSAMSVVAWVKSEKDSRSGTSQVIASKWAPLTSLSTFTAHDASALAKGFKGSPAFDGKYVYFAPYHDGSSFNGKILRYNTTTSFSNAANFEVFDASAVNASAIGFQGAVFDGRYVYFIPYWMTKVLRYDTQASFTTAGSWSIFDPTTVNANARGFRNAVFDGRYITFIPHELTAGSGNYHAHFVQYDTTADFTTGSSWKMYDAVSTDSMTTRGYTSGVFDGRYLYFVPDAIDTSTPSGRVLRYDTTASFTTGTSWQAYDAGSTGSANTKGYMGAAFDGRYIYFAPYRNAINTGHANVLRYDTRGSGGFKDAGSWSTYDITNVTGAAVESFSSAVFDGRFVHFIHRNNNYPRWTRYDTTGAFNQAGSWASSNQLTTNSLDTAGNEGAVFDGRYIYTSPYIGNSGAANGNIIQYDTTGSSGSFILKYANSGSADSGSRPLGAELTVSTSAGLFSVTAPSSLSASGWHQLAGVYDGASLKLYVDGALAASTPASGTIVANASSLVIGGISGGKSFFNGLIDEAQVYDAALTPTDLSNLFSADAAGACK